MTILLVSPLPPPAGGIATWTVMYREYCQSHDVPVRIVNTALQGTRAEKKGNKLRILEEMKRTYAVLRTFGKALKQERPDVVHLNSSCSKFGILRDCLCVLRAKRHRVPVVLQCHCNIEDQLKGKLAVKAFQTAANKAAAVWVLNRPSADFAKKHSFTEIMPVLCDFDYLTAGLMHARLLREHTVATGSAYCDYWYLGDKEPEQP